MGPLAPKMDNEQVTALYSQCIQLSTDNKIDVKNAWSLRLIDYIDDVLKSDQVEANSHETNFQKARYASKGAKAPLFNHYQQNFMSSRLCMIFSCTLDASVKIYSYRVDSVHQNTYKVCQWLLNVYSKSFIVTLIR